MDRQRQRWSFGHAMEGGEIIWTETCGMIIIAAVIGQFISALPLKLKVVLNVNVCDATGDAIGTTACYKKNQNH